MASKRRLRKKQCGDKHRHINQTEAVAQIKNIEKKIGYDAGYITYKCKWCKCWHVGRMKGFKK